MSWSVALNVSVQTATEEPLAELALAEPNWALRVVVFTVAENSLPSDINCRPSSDSSRGRFFVRGRGRSDRKVKAFTESSWFSIVPFGRGPWLASKEKSPTRQGTEHGPNGFFGHCGGARRHGLIGPGPSIRKDTPPGGSRESIWSQHRSRGYDTRATHTGRRGPGHADR